jgi:nucleotide sugar dehydrogenase
MNRIKKVGVIGLGYIGLPLFIAINKSNKYNTVGFDIDQEKINKLKTATSPIDDKIVKKFLDKNKVKISNNNKILKASDIFIVCVPTPVLDDYTPNYGPIISATKIAGKYLKKGGHFVLESTVNPGTCEEIVKPILEEVSGLKVGKDFNIAHCPERINPGDPKWNVYNIPRNIGSINKQHNKEIADFYRTFITDAKINEVDNLKIAEATKIVENTFRDINIAYVNELAQSFDSMGIDLYKTLQASANKPFGFMPHWPGCGVGGHCIAVDPYYLIKRASKNGFNHQFLKLAREINNNMPKYCISKLVKGLNLVGLPIKNTKIALLGLSYKPEVGDLRESPSLEIEKELKKLKADLTIYDPYINRGAKSLEECLQNTEAVIIATAHKEIVENLPGFLKMSNVKVIVDGRNCLSKQKIENMNKIYIGIGR